MLYFAHEGHDHSAELAAQANSTNKPMLLVGLAIVAVAVVLAVIVTKQRANDTKSRGK